VSLLRAAAADILSFPGGSDPPQTPPAQGGLTRPPIPPGGRGLRTLRAQVSVLAATGEALTSVTRASLEAALSVALRKAGAAHRRPLPTRFAVIAMGRFGGHECGYGSDADVLFVHDPLARPAGEGSLGRGPHGGGRAAQAAHAARCPTRPWSSTPTCAPEGRQGPLVRTLAAYRAYYPALVGAVGGAGAAARRAGRRRLRSR